MNQPQTGYQGPTGDWRYEPEQSKYLARDVDPYLGHLEKQLKIAHHALFLRTRCTDDAETTAAQIKEWLTQADLDLPI